MTNRPPAPIYLECYSETPGLPQRFLVDTERPALLDDGEWVCKAYAPNGTKTVIEITESRDPLDAEGLALRFREGGHAGDLWTPPIARPAAGEDVRRSDFAVWSGGEPVERHEWGIALPADAVEGEFDLFNWSERPIDFLQVAAEDGASLIIRCPLVPERLRFRCEQRRLSDPLRTVFTLGADDVLAYWGFTRHGITRGAYELGKRIAAACIEGRAGPYQTIAAGHWTIAFGETDLDRLAVLRHRLAEDDRVERDLGNGYCDAGVLEWILEAQQSGGDLAPVDEHFWSLAQRIIERPPLFTATMRLFVPYLLAAASRHDQQVKEDTPHSRRFRALWGLASAMVWDSEFTTYRGLAPHQPDPNALSVHIDERAKKKSARRILSP